MSGTQFVQRDLFTPDFDGKTYQRERDHERLSGQLNSVRKIMSDGNWRTINQIVEGVPGSQPQSISARLRDLRKPKFGGFEVERKCLGGGLWVYRLLVQPAKGEP